jgi:hypothetical protein
METWAGWLGAGAQSEQPDDGDHQPDLALMSLAKAPFMRSLARTCGR